MSSCYLYLLTHPYCGADAGSYCRGEYGQRALGPHNVRLRHGREEADFWIWVDRRLSEPDTVGMTEQQFLDIIRTPGWIGRKARTVQNVSSMPQRDFRMAAANDNEAA